MGFNGDETPGTITSTGADFTLQSAYMGAAWFPEQVTVQGWDDGALVATKTLTLDTNRNLVTFDGFTSIDKVTFVGLPNEWGQSSQVVLDDVMLTWQQASRDVLQVDSQAVADGLLGSAHDVAGGVALDYNGYHAVLLGQQAANVTADWFRVA